MEVREKVQLQLCRVEEETKHLAMIRETEQRQEESKTILTRYPDRVPLMIERYSRTNLPDIENNKFLVPRDMSVGQFIHILTRRLQLSPGKALFVFVNNTLPQTASLMGYVYNSFKNEDGFLYMCYRIEKTFD
ncbi:autophagy-related protein 8i-like [Hibiscus syriacus]|uniref:autophagy-related protein 8i-like n=1 Tax=Hibiscus syriacus TaxID=106335 RepID=UPI0019209DC9|nr:autophagy-related protein 8i-like [Hibiscus syriacus]